MSMTLDWDGLHIDLPESLEPAVLDQGFIRLVHVHQTHPETVDLRFEPERSPFHPDRDGRRLLKAAGIRDQSLVPFDSVPNPATELRIWVDSIQSPLLYILHSQSWHVVIAARFSSSPSASLIHSLASDLRWTPVEAWRSWHVRDLSFETPPRATLIRAGLHPGSIHTRFQLHGAILNFERLAPASILLANTDLESWLRLYLRSYYSKPLDFNKAVQDRICFQSRLQASRRMLARFLPKSHIRGQAIHDQTRNRLLIVTTVGHSLTDHVFNRICRSYAPATNSD